ncbi:MAG: hypothetical protein JO336_06550, partial [Acidobacteriia bacterium]|nr:hypothetical protein [Terriglobia bacterium]
MIQCSGFDPLSFGQLLAPGQSVPQGALTVFFNAPLSGRVFENGASEILLLIDEPNSGQPAPVPGFGSQQPVTLCPGSSVCSAWAQQATIGGKTYAVAVNAPNASASPGNAAPNAYQGVVGPDLVTFSNIPVLPPGTTGVRTFRVTNVRAGPGLPGTGVPVIASVLMTDNPQGGLIINQPLTVGNTEPSLTTSAAALFTLPGCLAQPLQQATVLTYAERFNSAFKTRVDPTIAGQTSG